MTNDSWLHKLLGELESSPDGGSWRDWDNPALRTQAGAGKAELPGDPAPFQRPGKPANSYK